jgi:putative hydrolase of the HAD superfamily
MKQFKNITTLIFDLGGVLVDLDLSRCIKNFKRLGLENFEEQLSLFGQKGFFLQYELGEIGNEEFRKEIRRLSRNPLTDEQIDAAWCSFLCDISPQKIKQLLELKQKFRLLVLSNTNSLHIETSTKGEFTRYGLKLSDVFEKCYFSYEMKMAKPDAKIFETVLADARLKPEECLFLDDGTKNIEQAAKLGIQTYLVKSGENLDFLLYPQTFIYKDKR